MTVSFTNNSGGSAISLAGAEDDLNDGPLNHHIRNQIVVQTDNIVGASAPARFGRGNRTFPFQLTVTKKHASYEACWAYILGHIKDFVDIGTVVFTQGSAVLTLLHVDLSADGHPFGASSEWTYSGTGVVS